MRSAQNHHQDRQERIRRLRARAEQARTIAAEVGDQITRANLLNVAISYDNTADFLSRLPSGPDTAYPRLTQVHHRPLIARKAPSLSKVK